MSYYRYRYRADMVRACKYVLGRGYIEARTDTTQQSGHTPDKEVEIKNITGYVNGYIERPNSRRR